MAEKPLELLGRKHDNISYSEHIARRPLPTVLRSEFGKDTVIVTRDLMRGHRFLLKERRYKLLFNRWLTQRQYQLFRVDNRRGPVFRVPLPFSNLAQKNGDTWHVPYEVEQKNDQDEFHKMWLCMKR
ncbi:hypothetical protein NQ317_002130 [Molorchus minor]|uniref:PRORP domain-containing protein n=1 Tax=Molorchus minor TaxID=1323400 RepID=A0ABQ9JVT8_9CUCU|nr:hypothetical protein NQ317_002130 [Molorchus minor]